MRLIDEIKALPTDRRSMREFGLTMGGALAFFGAIALWKGSGWSVPLALASGVSAALGIAIPMILGPAYRVWMTLALCLGWVMTRVILTLVFFAALTPIALLMRLAGKDLVGLRKPKNCSTYWTTRAITESDKSRFERQF